MTANLTIDQTAVIGAEVAMPAGVVQSAQSDVVAGYELQQRIGVGGYGEVWRAVGPGGLPKAVKILHGLHDGPQADAELKSLERMRELRHPFLLSVERIEVINDRLIIVTELADGSLEARFKQVRRAGHRGIPRDELLGYMRDAADALDFLFDRHGLQHLDVKPSNLLLLGEHLKLADFGLIKDIRQTNVSLVGGFTPLYAPPELFEGRPGKSSDQYSLAIVYQMMLTGAPPFAGRTAAQLTAQHLNSPPDLTALPLSDRPAVTRALSKNPAARFDSCREFVDRLSERRSPAGRTQAGPEVVPPAATPAAGATAPIERSADDTARLVAQPARRETVPLPPVGADPAATTYRPTIFLGIGGLAGRALKCLRQRLNEQFGGAPSLPALPLLYIDTDPQAISAVRSGDDEAGLAPHETLVIPLREPQDYRASSDELLQWLSRRWLYNIPKSRQAEGIRPLGRLALMDHLDDIRNRFGSLVETACTADAARLTGQTTGLTFTAGPPDVVLLASICGGTGSGAVLDAAYLVRDTLTQLQREPAWVSAVLLIAAGPRPQARRLELANAVACLTELDQFSRTGYGYPGDPSRRLAAHDRGPFDTAHVIQLDSSTESAGWEQPCSEVAEYLVRRTATPARAFFEACRGGSDSADPAGDTRCLRTFGAAAHREAADEHAVREVDALCRVLIRHWRGSAPATAEGKPATHPEVVRQATAAFGKLQLNSDQLATMVASMTQGELVQRIDNYFQTRWTPPAGPPATGKPPLATVVEAIDREYGQPPPAGQDPEHPAAILRHLTQQLRSSAQKCVQALQGELLALMDHGAARLDAACEALSDFIFRLDHTADDLLPLVKKLRGEMQQLVATPPPATGDPPSEPPSSPAVCRRYFLLKFCEGIWLCWIRYLRTVRDQLAQAAPALELVRGRLVELENHFSSGDPPAGGSTARRRSRWPARTDESLVQAFDVQLRADGSFGLAKLISNDPNRGFKRLAAALRREAHALLVRLGLAPVSHPPASVKNSGHEAELVRAIAPRLSNLGGGRRVLAVLPSHSASSPWPARLAEQFGNCVTQLPDAGGESFFCCEVEGIPIRTVIDRLASEHVAILQMAARLHTRIDVEWKSR